MSYRFNPLLKRHLDMSDSIPGVLDYRYLKLTGSLAEVTNHSHTVLTDIGTNTHAQIDTFIGTTVPGTYLKLDQTTPQTTVGTFTFPSVITTSYLKTPKIYPSADSTTSVQILKANGTTAVLSVDTTNNRVGIGITSPTGRLEVFNSAYIVNPMIYCHGSNPLASYQIERASGGVAFDVLSLSALNTTSGLSNLYGVIGAVGSLQTDPTAPTLTYMYFGADTDAAYTKNTLRLYPGQIANFQGNVGIGTITPASKLDVCSATGGILTISRVDTIVAANDTVGIIQFYAADTQTTSNFIVANIEAQATNSITTDINPGRLIFRTTSTTVADTPTERMRITEAGNVGIGTTTPTRILGIGGLVARNIGMERGTVAATAGFALTINAGGATSGATNVNGGDLYLTPGVGTGTGTSNVYLQVNPAGSTGTTDTTPTTVLSLLGASGFVWNDGGLATQDFRVESDTEENMIFLDSNGDTDGALYLGGTTNGVKINKGGELTLLGTATVYQDANVGGLVLRTGGTAPGVVQIKDNDGDDTGIYTVGFAVGEEGSGVIEIPHDYKEGSNITFHIHWGANDAPAGGTDNIKWQLTYSIARGANTFPDSITPAAVEVAYTTQYQYVFTDIATITGSTGGVDGGNIKIGDQFHFSIKRIAASSDEYGGEALMGTLGLHYEVDTMGSKTISAK